MTPATRESAGRAAGNELAATLAFFGAGLLAIALTRIAGEVSLVWPANALAAALLVREGQPMRVRAAFSLWCAGTLANIVAAADDPLTAGALTAANVFEVWVTTRLLWPLWRDGAPTVDLALGGRILLMAGLVAPAAGALPGALVAHVFLGASLLDAAATWWQSSVCGAALVAPVVYLFSREELRGLWKPVTRHLSIALVLVTLLVTPLAIRYVVHSFIVVAAPVVIAALVMGALGTAILCMLAGVETIAFWAAGLGPVLGDTGPSTLPLLPMVLLLIVPIVVGLAVNDRRRAVQAQQASQRWTQQLIEQSPIGMCILTLDGIWELTNAVLLKMLDYTAEEVHGRLNAELFVAEEFAAGKARVQWLLRGERTAYTAERRFRHRDGSWIWTRCTTTLMRDAAGEPARFIVQVENLAEQRRVEHELAIERERLAITLRSIVDAVVVTDASRCVTYLNEAAEQMLGKTLSEVSGRQIDDIVFVSMAGEQGAQLSIASLCAARDQAIRREAPGRLHLADGSTRYVEESAAPLHDPDGVLSGVVVVLRDVRSQFEREQQLRRDAELDQLTGLANRRAFEERVEAVVSRCGMLGSTATLLLLDLDHFKRINDQAGHPAGDEMLRQVALALRRSARSSDLIARLGGDEFAVVLDDCGEARARQIAQEILRNVLAIRMSWEGDEYSVGASIGGAAFTATIGSARDWIAAADRACYSAKAVGRGQIRFSSAS